MSSNEIDSKKFVSITVTLLIVVFGFLLIRRAWICDDAYITFRTVDNLLNGYRLTWNVTERVQVYTHPLWMLLVAVFDLITKDIYLTSIFLSLAISIVTIILLASKISKVEISALFGIVVLSFSKAFMDYSTSGLENPLSHLLVVLFFIVYFIHKNDVPKILILSILMSLSITNRMDTLLLLLPALILAVIQCKGRKWLLYLALGQLPFILWEIFSLFYYGFPFPNTAYAKLNTGIPSGEIIQQGFLYLLNSIQHDPITLTVISLGIVIPFIIKNDRLIPISVGMLAYIAYIVKIGGDFMSGRFLTIPLLCAVIIISRYDFSRLSTVSLTIAFALPLIMSISTPNSPLQINEFGEVNAGPIHIGENGILDERLLYYGGTGLLNATRSDPLPNFYWGIHGEEARYEKLSVADAYGVGLYGFYAGPEVFVLDKLAIADPLLARLPAKRRVDWRPGHFEREMPEGYLQTLLSGSNSIEDPDLHLFYDKLSVITRGKLTSPQRLAEIWKMNTGQYDYLINRDFYRYPDIEKINIDEIQNAIPNKTSCNDEDVYIINDSGIEISLNETSHADIIETSLDHNDSYQIDYLLDASVIDSQTIPTAHLQDPGGLSIRRFYTPTSVQQKGFNAIRILPLTGEEEYCIGALSFTK